MAAMTAREVRMQRLCPCQLQTQATQQQGRMAGGWRPLSLLPPLLAWWLHPHLQPSHSSPYSQASPPSPLPLAALRHGRLAP